MRLQRPGHIRERQSRLLDFVPCIRAFADSCVGLTHLLPHLSKPQLSMAVVGLSYTRFRKTHTLPWCRSRIKPGPWGPTGFPLEGGRRASVQVQNFATTFTTLMMFICAYALRQSGNHLYFLMATEKILHLKLVCLVVTSESV
jgi:hypothetical protein